MLKHLFAAMAVVVMVANGAAAGSKPQKIEAKVLYINFCSPERESVCVNTDKGYLTLMSPYSGAIDGDSFKELFHMLHVVQGETVDLILVDDGEIIGIKTQGYAFIAPELDGKTLKTLTPRKMP